MTRYSGRQLAVAKCLIVVLCAIILGVQLADAPGDRALTIAVALLMLGGSVAAYELIARGLAIVIGGMPTPKVRALRPKPSDAEVLEPTSRRLRLWHVLALVAAYLGAMTFVWIAGAIIASTEAGPHVPKAAFGASLLKLSPILLPASQAAGGLTVLLALRRWAAHLDEATYSALVPSRWGTSRQVLAAAVAGLASGIAYLMLARAIAYHPTRPPSLLALVATTPGATRWAWMVSALLLAPPIEEALFRGALLGGLAGAWGVPAAMLLSGAAFWLLHASEWINYWPAAVGIGMLTALVTVLRVRTKALGPCIAAHMAYNLVLIMVSLGYR